MSGHTLGYDYAVPNSTSNIYSTNVTVGNGVELSGLYSAHDAGPVDFTDNQIIFNFGAVSFASAGFNGVHISDRFNELPDIQNVQLDPVSALGSGGTTPTISFDHDNIFVNFQGMFFSGNAPVILDVLLA